ncbi:MAG TPA: TetR/AcrR family transcriptional regulator [Frankiaceae bacterium]|jgi:AcrR family transcriptional regulator|nr:TetR/AcrR family transcriptional regulator [Frankiaceae bacterium]
MPRAKQRTPELRDRVLAAALEMLANEGVGGLTTRAVARAAGTSVPAVYELFGDKAGLVREMFFTGFRRLHEQLLELDEARDPGTSLMAMAMAFRAFAREEPALTQLMFSRPFAEFDPSPADSRAGAAVRGYVVDLVSAAIAARVVAGDPTDIAHVLLATVQGLAVQESGGWLGSTPASIERRWALAVNAVLRGVRAPVS